MSLFKRGNIWWTQFYVDGTRYQQSTGATTRRQADTIEMKLRAEANGRRFQLVEYNPDLTVAALASQFLSDGDVRPHHVWHLKALLPFFGDMKVLRLNRNDAREFRTWRKRQGVTDATVNRALSVLRHIFFWALDEKLIQANPLARVPMVAERRLKRPVMTVLEEAALLPALPQHLRRIVITALDTGMRRGEILKQLWEDVDLSRRLLLVSTSKTAGGEAREIPLTARTFSLLSEKPEHTGFVFTLNGNPLSWIRKGYLAGIKRAGLRHFRFHDLRHTFNTRLMEAGVIADIRMALMGHSGGSRVHSIYTHVELPTKRKAVSQLEAWVTQQQELQTQTQKENNDASTEGKRSQNERKQSDAAGNSQGGTQTVEEEVTG